MAFRAYKRDAKGRFAGSGSQPRQEARLAANERRTTSRAKDVTTAAQLGAGSNTLRTSARKVQKSIQTNAKARNVYKSKRLRNRG